MPVFGISHKPPKRQLPEWSEGQTGESGLTGPQKKRHLEGGAISERDRIETPCKKEDYSFFHYLSYSLYSPLYLAGPIVTFNDFIDQVRGKKKTNFTHLEGTVTNVFLATTSSTDEQSVSYSALWHSPTGFYIYHGGYIALHVRGCNFQD